jgi:outer membrane receptor protein involved in Fe transport
LTISHRALFGTALTSFAIACASPAMAQQAGLQIAVVDAENGTPVADAQIVIENREIGLRRVERSNEQGMVRLEALATGGAYIVSVPDSARYQGVLATPVSLRSNFARSVTLHLKPIGGEAIVVTAKRAVTGINTVNAEISASLSKSELAALPIEGRDVIGSLVRLPNVVASTGFFPEAPGISINGANGLDTNYLIDGLDNNENFLGGLKFPVPLGFAREVTVLANSYSVVYGRTPNGIVNYTSPSGTNDYHGEVYALVRPGQPLDARSAFPRRDLSGNPVGESFERYQTGASIGGPVVRDRTFFYANLEYTRDHNRQIVDAPALGTVANVTGNNEFLLGSLRLDHRLTEDWTLSLRANVGRATIDRPGGALGGGNVTFPSAGSDEDRFSTNIAGSVSYSGDDWSYDGSVQFSRFRWNYGKPKGPAGQQVSIRDQSGLTIGVVGHPGFVFNDLEKSWQTVHRLQRTLGDHRLSIGADVIRSDFSLFGGGNPDGNFTVDLTPAQIAALGASGKGLNLSSSDVLSLDPAVINYSVELRPQSFGTSQTQFAAYVEDEWQVGPKLTATLGVRWDYDTLTAKGGTAGDKNNFAPRLALNYRPDARSSFRFGAGLFYGKLSYAVISDALQRNTTSPGFLAQLGQLQSLGIIRAGARLDEATFDGNLTVSPPCATVSACPSPASLQGLRDTATINEARILNPDGYQSPYSLQISGGYQFQATDTISVSADIIYSRSHNLVRLRDLNAPSPFSPNLANLTDANIALLRAQPDNATRFALAQTLGLVRSQTAADATRPVALVAGGARQITVSETAGKATYRAFNLQLNKARGNDDYALRLSYTLSKLTNDTDDINFRASNANNFAADNGPSANDRRHVISAVGFLYPVEGLTLTVAGLFQSGQPVNLVPDARIFGTQDLNGDGQSFGENFVGNSDRYPGAARNSARLAWSASVDLGLRYALPALAGKLELSADVFNVFNTNNESGFANAARTSNQVQFGGGAPFTQRNAGPPRQCQFGVAFKF